MKLKNTSDSNAYFVSNSIPFEGKNISDNHCQKVFEFAYEMSFGEGYHRKQRTGGLCKRKSGEIFCNAFQGKLAEIILYDFFISNNLEAKEPDFGIYKEGIWDDTDLEIRDKKINVKSVAQQSNLLLLETQDWNKDGFYIPNLNNGKTTFYDYFVLVRISPDLKKIFASKKLLSANQIEKDEIFGILKNENWKYDFAGYATHADIMTVIKEGNILPQNSILNKWTKMDAENYYLQSGDMRHINNLIHELKSTE